MMFFHKSQFHTEDIFLGFEYKTNPNGNQTTVEMYILERNFWSKLKRTHSGKTIFIGKAKIEMFPGCSGIDVIHDFYIEENYRNQNYGKCLLNYIVTNANRSTLMMTINDKTPSMHSLAKRFNFKSVNEFTNRRTFNNVTIYALNF